MKRLKMFVMVLCVLVAIGLMPAVIGAEEYRVVFLQSNGTDAPTYRQLAEHMKKTGVSVKLMEVPSFAELKRRLSAGEVDALLSGPGIPGAMYVIHRLRIRDSQAGFKPQDSTLQKAMRSH